MRPAFVWQPGLTLDRWEREDECIESATLRATDGGKSTPARARAPVPEPTTSSSTDDVDQAFMEMFSETPPVVQKAPAQPIIVVASPGLPKEAAPAQRPRPDPEPPAPSAAPPARVAGQAPRAPHAAPIAAPERAAPTMPPTARVSRPRRREIAVAAVITGGLVGALVAFGPMRFPFAVPSPQILGRVPASSMLMSSFTLQAHREVAKPEVEGSVPTLAAEPVERATERVRGAPVAPPRARRASGRSQRPHLLIERAPYRSIPVKPGEKVAAFPL